MKHWRIYLKYLSMAYLAFGGFAFVQMVVVLKSYSPQFFVIPAVVAFLIGSLLGKLAVMRERLQHASGTLRAVADMAQEFIYYRDLDGKYLYISPSVHDLTAYDEADFFAKSNFMLNVIHPEDRQRWQDYAISSNYGSGAESLDVRILTKDGKCKWIRHVCAPVFDNKNQQIGVRSANMDITEHKLAEEKVSRMAYYDTLTDLPNRRLFEKNLKAMIEKASQEDDVFSVLFVDLDRFKNLNDSFGHHLGDKVLIQVARIIKEFCNQICLLSRFGGDEFVLICSELRDSAAAEKFARGLIDRIEQPFIIDDVNIYISATVGIAFYPQDGTECSMLIRNADTAMYKSKKSMANKVQFYQSEFGNEATQFVTTEANIHAGLRNQEFIPYYQPKVDIRTGQIVGMEALVRWNNTERGIIMPGSFIHVAEETGQIIDIGKQLVEHVIEDIRDWSGLGINLPVAINVSARQFSNSSYCNDIESMFRKSPIPEGSIEIEITEQVFLGDLDMAREHINNFREKGIRIALDDFGTGYSSLSYLSKLPIDILKIDKAFVDNITHDDTSKAIMRAISIMCQDLGYMPIAEGVETEEQKQMLLQLGCNFAQGYLFYKPMSVSEIRELLSTQRQKITVN